MVDFKIEGLLKRRGLQVLCIYSLLWKLLLNTDQKGNTVSQLHNISLREANFYRVVPVI